MIDNQKYAEEKEAEEIERKTWEWLVADEVEELRRVNRSGLAGAVIEGWMSSSADFVAVIDGDLQHDESILPQMYEALARGSGNLAIGARIRSASGGGGLSPARQALSDMGAWFFSESQGPPSPIR